MKNAVGWIVTLVFVAILGIGLLGPGLTGQATGYSFVVTYGTVLSVIAATLAIGVLIVAGFKQSNTKRIKKK